MFLNTTEQRFCSLKSVHRRYVFYKRGNMFKGHNLFSKYFVGIHFGGIMDMLNYMFNINDHGCKQFSLP